MRLEENKILTHLKQLSFYSLSFQPNFYGYFPDSGRLFVMFLMISMSASHVLLKVIGCSLMLRMNQTWFIIYMASDQSMYFLYKLLRGDWRYGLRLPGMVSWIVSMFVRVMIKTIVDFTLIIHYRHPFDLGGIYWSTNIVLNQAFCFVSVYLYRKYSAEMTKTNSTDTSATDNGTLDGIDSSQVTTPPTLPLVELVIGLFVLSMLSFGFFLSRINKEYLVTFYDPRTASQFLCDNWRNGISDKERFYVFSKHPSLYESINKELKDWLSENWSKWEEEREDWFTAKVIGKIPSELLPEKFSCKLGVDVKGRRKSIDAMIKAEEKEVVVEKARRASAAQIVPSE